MRFSDENLGRLTRREALAGGVCLLVGGLAGCTRASEFIADRVTGELNLFNTLNRRLSGSLELVGPDGETLLDERVELAPSSGGSGGEREPAAIYEGVLETAGSYQLTLDIDTTGEPDGSRLTGTYEVTDPGEQRLVVLLGGEFTEAFIFVSVIEDFAELDDEIEG